MKIPQGRQANLYGFVVLKHDQQKRKYTNEPYHTHVRAVADMADGKCKFGYEIGLCHDLFEDTDCTHFELQKALERFGYSEEEALFIVINTIDLTDIYTPEAFPQLNRAKRKVEEAKRLHKIGYDAQTVKYCDLIHNTYSIVKYDTGFALKYIPEKQAILKGMNQGNPAMYQKAKRVLNKAKKQLGI